MGRFRKLLPRTTWPACAAVLGVMMSYAPAPTRAGVIMPEIVAIPHLAGGEGVSPRDVNAAGVVVGVGFLGGDYHAFRYAGGVTVDIGPMPPGHQSLASGINNHGVIVGHRDDLPTRWVNGVPQRVFGLADARRVNDAGVIMGMILVGGRQHVARLHPSTGDVVDLTPGAPGADFFGYDMNGAGVAVGDGGTATSSAVFKVGPAPGQFTPVGPSDTGFDPSSAHAISDGDWVVGNAIKEIQIGPVSYTLVTHAYRNRGGVTEDLGTLPGGAHSYGNDVNIDGVAVGYSFNGAGDIRAVAWKPGGAILDLDAWLDQANPSAGANWTLTQALLISDDGHVVGIGQTQDGRTRNFVLHAPGFLPEPTAALPMLMAAAWRVGGRRRRTPTSTTATTTTGMADPAENVIRFYSIGDARERQNMPGQILMQVRAELRAESPKR